ncbi:MAG: carbohydrate porin [Alphaproteobacteria bacterium]|nr:carbohydrate porin [Alphaproteobacteria bacterium]
MRKILAFTLTGIVFATSQAFALPNRGATGRANATEHKISFSELGKEYSDWKNYLKNEHGFNYSVDVSFMPQYGSPSGKTTAWQTIVAPSFAWTNFDNEYGTGILNFAYNIVRYSGSQAEKIENNIGVVTPINDYDTKSTSFNELYYSYQLPNSWNWLTFALGQYSFYNFDGTTYNSNQQINFINYSLSQNGSASYSIAGLGAYVQIMPNEEWNFAFGAQDASNIDGVSVRFNKLEDKHYATFVYGAYMPTITSVGQSEISVMLYNQPWVKEQQQTTNGWSVNLSQNVGEKLSFFGRINGVSGNMMDIKQSWVFGGVCNNPINRNSLDQIGLAFAYNRIDEKAVGNKLSNKREKIIETYWTWGVSKWLAITPDLQFYIDPAQNAKSDYGTAVSLRATLFF